MQGIVGASLSEDCTTCSLRRANVAISGTSVIPYTCGLLFLREIFEIVQLRSIAWGGLGTRLNNAIRYQHGAANVADSGNEAKQTHG